jgi:putative flippase GtrA
MRWPAPEHSNEEGTTAVRPPTVSETLQKIAWRPWANGEHRLITRYLLVSGVFGVPASILQLQAMLWAYEAFVGDYDRLILNALWIVNFEIGLSRNFLLFCAFTWRTPPTWMRYGHAHVAAIGAFVVDITVFNLVVTLTGVVLIGQVCGAGSGFFFNFLYNRFRTFGAAEAPAEKPLPEGIA